MWGFFLEATLVVCELLMPTKDNIYENLEDCSKSSESSAFNGKIPLV